MRVRAIVMACVRAGELRLILEPGSGHVDGGAPFDAKIETIPRDLRMPNTPLWIDFAPGMQIVAVSKRDPDV